MEQIARAAARESGRWALCGWASWALGLASPRAEGQERGLSGGPGIENRKTEQAYKAGNRQITD